MTPQYDYSMYGGAKEEVRLILVSTDANSNKYWNATLCGDGTIVVANGRVGGTGQVRPVSSHGDSGLQRLIAEKTKKGYVPQRVLPGSAAQVTAKSKVTNGSDLLQKAKRDIVASASDKRLLEIIEFLVRANVHQITDSTSIKFDDTSGLFSTPLGVLTQDAITDAREILTQIHAGMCKNDIPSKLVNEYLQIVPQKVGSRLDVKALFGTSEKINAQMRTLDSLEASIGMLEDRRKAATQVDDTKPDEPATLFPVKLDIETRSKELKWINDFYTGGKKTMHGCHAMKIKNIFTLEHIEGRKEFEKLGRPIGNVQRYWHGTSAANLLSIMKSGLRTTPPATARIAGKAFGHGIYFSDIATKSLNYATGYWGGQGDKNRAFMLLNDVAMGKIYDPSRCDSYGSWPKNGTNSTFAKGGTVFANNEMIVYQNYQATPTHLVEFGS